MTPLARWRTAALVATLGWGATALGWALSSPQTSHVDARSASAADARTRHRRGAPALPRPIPAVAPRNTSAAPATEGPELAALRDQVRQEVLEEVEQERAERRQERSERHLERLLDDVAAFADEYGLDNDTRSSLESSMASMHDRLEELRPQGPPGPGGPSPEAMDALEEAFDVFRDEVDMVLDDPELADEFTERMTPRPLRGPPGG